MLLYSQIIGGNLQVPSCCRKLSDDDDNNSISFSTQTTTMLEIIYGEIPQGQM